MAPLGTPTEIPMIVDELNLPLWTLPFGACEGEDVGVGEEGEMDEGE